MKKIIVIAQMGWSIERVFRDVANYFKDDYQFVFFNALHFYMDKFMKEYTDSVLCITTGDLYIPILNLLKSTEDRKKILVCFHGQVEVTSTSYIDDMTYTLTSDRLVFPHTCFITPNGVDLSHFIYMPKNGTLKILGWCGAPKIKSKRFELAEEIANKVRLPLKVAGNPIVSFSDMKLWYHSIDLLLVTAGPDENSETGPLPAFEAIVSGCPVIGTRVGNFCHVPGPKFSTIEEACVLLEDFQTNPTKLKELSEIQYNWVKNNWTYAQLGTLWRTAIDSAIQKSQNTE